MSDEQVRIDCGRLNCWLDGTGASAEEVIRNPTLDESVKQLARTFLHIKERLGVQHSTLESMIERWRSRDYAFKTPADCADELEAALAISELRQAEREPAATEIKRWFCQRCQAIHSIAMPISGCEQPLAEPATPK